MASERQRGDGTEGEAADGDEATTANGAKGTTADADDVEVVLIAAVAANGVIGDDGGMPWHLPEDLRHFKETTTGHPVIAGRRTFESVVDRIGGPLPERTNVVLSRSEPDVPEGVRLAEDVDAALETARDAARERGVETVYVVGGASVYEAFLDRADRMVLTEIDEAHEGDTEFPAWPPGEAWREVEHDERDGLAFVTYERAQ